MGVSVTTVQALRVAGHDAVHLPEEGLIRLPDPDVVAKAAQEQTVVLTFDLDFGDVLALGVLDKPSVIIFRLSDERPESVNRRLAVILADCAAVLESGVLISVNDTRYRVRKLPIGRTDRS